MKKSFTGNKKLQFFEDLPNLKEETIQKVSNDVMARRLIPSYPTYLDQYLSGCAQMHLHIGWLDNRTVRVTNPVEVRREIKRDYCIVLEKLGRRIKRNMIVTNRLREATQGKGKRTILPTAPNRDKLTVLVSIFESAEDAKTDNFCGYSKVGELIGLYAYDECPSLRVDVLNSGIKAIPPLGIIDHEITTFVFGKDVFKDNWEASVVSSLFGDASDNNIVKCTSQVMYEVSEHNGNHRVRLLSDLKSPYDFILAIRQPNTSETVRIATCVPFGFSLDVYHVLLSPFILEPPIVHDVLQYPYGEKNGKDTKDSKGARDTLLMFLFYHYCTLRQLIIKQSKRGFRPSSFFPPSPLRRGGHRG